jgi:basic amino acid/polyamine antiporter, APA family
MKLLYGEVCAFTKKHNLSKKNTMESNQSEGLKRELGITDVATNVINITIGSGIFLLPALIAGILGNASIVAYILCGFMFLLVVLCYAEASSRITTSGGAYAYIEKAFGPFFGFIANTLFWFGGGVLIAAALVNGIADILSVAFPIFDIAIYRALLFLILFIFFAYSNIKGIKQSMKVPRVTTVLKLLPLILLVIVGLCNINTSNLHWNGFPSSDKLGAASIILFSAFIGGETALNVSGEMKNPRRTAPLGLIIGVVSVVVFYSLIQIAAQSALGASLINQKAPLAAVAGKLAGNWGIKILIVGGVISIFGSLYSGILVFSRVLFAGANDGLMPKYLSKVHPKYATPYWAIITLLVIAYFIAISGGFRQLIILASISMLLLYVGVALAVIKFRLKGSKEYPAAFILPGGLLIPVITLIILTWFIFQSKPNEISAIGIFLTILTVIYTLKLFFKKGFKKSIPDLTGFKNL